MGCRRAMRDDVSAHRRIVKRLINCPIVTIAVVADRKCFRKHESHTSWGTRDTTRGPSYVVDLDHMAEVLPGPHAYPRCEHRSFDFHAVTVELLVSKKVRRQDRRFASTGILDLPQTHHWRVCFCRRQKRKAAKHQQNCSYVMFNFFISNFLLFFVL